MTTAHHQPANQFVSVELPPDDSGGLIVVCADTGARLVLSPPTFEIDGDIIAGVVTDWSGEPPAATPGTARETVFRGPLRALPDVELLIRIRLSPDSPVIRFAYELRATAPHRLTRTSGRDRITHFGFDTTGWTDRTEIRLSGFSELFHSFLPAEVALRDETFAAESRVFGPLLVGRAADTSWLVGYEHGSTYPDAFLAFDCRPGGRCEVTAVKGHHRDGQPLDRETFRSAWFQVAAVAGTPDDLADRYREFVRADLADFTASREPWIFYNTWNHQERNRNLRSLPYLAEMTESRMLAEIDAAAEIGIEVFVIDTGWYSRTGDWEVDLARFPAGLDPIRERLTAHGMRLGLWFNPTTAALTSRIRRDYEDCVQTLDGVARPPAPIWETEASQPMCLVSRYGDAFADELIRLVREVGVTYFKWDAVDQYGCDDPGHDHGGPDDSPRTRADLHAFEQVRAMARIARRVSEVCPEAIVDFDVTESHRCFGLTWLTAGKYFLVNNGPYFRNFDFAEPPTGNDNVFFFPGPARGWICRAPLTFDRWIPSTLLLTHHLPDDPAANQWIALGSLILGSNGLWGDLPAISPEGRSRFRRWLDLYKQVRHDLAATPLQRTGEPGASPEIYEKIHPDSARGVVVIFANDAADPPNGDAGVQHRHITTAIPADAGMAMTPGTTARRLPDGRVEITALFHEPSAAIVFFGVRDVD